MMFIKHSYILIFLVIFIHCNLKCRALSDLSYRMACSYFKHHPSVMYTEYMKNEYYNNFCVTNLIRLMESIYPNLEEELNERNIHIHIAKQIDCECKSFNDENETELTPTEYIQLNEGKKLQYMFEASCKDSPFPNVNIESYINFVKKNFANLIVKTYESTNLTKEELHSTIQTEIINQFKKYKEQDNTINSVEDYINLAIPTVFDERFRSIFPNSLVKSTNLFELTYKGSPYNIITNEYYRDFILKKLRVLLKIIMLWDGNIQLTPWNIQQWLKYEIATHCDICADNTIKFHMQESFYENKPSFQRN